MYPLANKQHLLQYPCQSLNRTQSPIPQSPSWCSVVAHTHHTTRSHLRVPSKLLEIPVTLKLRHTMSVDTELLADRIHPSTVASNALLSRPVGVCSWPPLAIHSVYCLRNSALKGRFTLTSSGCSMPVRPPGITAMSVPTRRICSLDLIHHVTAEAIQE